MAPQKKTQIVKAEDLSEKQVLGFLLMTDGQITNAAKLAKCNYRTFRKAMQLYGIDPEELLNDGRKALLDLAEETLYRKVEEGSLHATQFVLRCLGKDRGYTEQSRLDANALKAVPIKFEYVLEKNTYNELPQEPKNTIDIQPLEEVDPPPLPAPAADLNTDVGRDEPVLNETTGGVRSREAEARRSWYSDEDGDDDDFRGTRIGGI